MDIYRIDSSLLSPEGRAGCLRLWSHTPRGAIQLAHWFPEPVRTADFGKVWRNKSFCCYNATVSIIFVFNNKRRGYGQSSFVQITVILVKKPRCRCHDTVCIAYTILQNYIMYVVMLSTCPFLPLGVNTILKSIDLKEGDGVLATNNTYPAMQFTCEHVTTAANGMGLLP